MKNNMKHLFMKISGISNTKDFYLKYPTEAAFLKAHPKAKAQLKKFATGGQMNAQAMQQFAGGGFFQDAGEGIGNYFKAVADTTLGTFGATNVIKDSDYSGYGANEMSNLNKTLQPMTNTAAKIIGGAVGGPLGAAAVGGAQQLIGSFNPEDNTGLDENGNPKNPDAAKYQQAGQTVAQLGGIGAQIYGASKAPNFNSGVQNNGLMKRAMGGMQYAMGGVQYANGGTGEINAEVEDNENAIGPNGEFTQFSGPTHAKGGIETDMAPGTIVFSEKIKMPGSGKSPAELNKLYNTNKEDDVLSNEKSNNTLRLTAMLMRDAKLKQSLALFQAQEQFKQDKVAAYAKRMGVQIPSQNNEQMEPQGMPEQSQGEMAIVKHGGMINYMAMGGIQESDYQTDPGKLSDIQRQLRVVKQQISVIQPDSQYVPGPLAKLRGLEKDLTIRQNNHPEFKKAMGGKLPMYQDGDVVPKPQQQSFYGNSSNWGNAPVQSGYTGFIPPSGNAISMKGYTENDGNYNQNNSVNLATGHLYGNYIKGYPDNYNPNVEDQDQMFNYDQDGNLDLNNYNIGNLGRSFPDHEYNNNPNYKFPHNEMNRYLNDANMANSTLKPKSKNTQNLSNQINPNYGPENQPGWSVRTNTDTKVDTKVDPKDKGKGFDYKKAAGNLGQFALQNAGNIYDLYRSTQDNSKLNLSRVSPTFLDKTQDLQNNLRLYSEGKRQTAEASQGNASTYLSNMYANRASKLANDLNINTTYGNLNASIDNAAKLYNAGAIDKETMFKLQAEGMNRNLKGQALAGMSQNFLNQKNSDRQDALDQERLGLQKQYYKAFYDNQDRENQRRVDEITKGKSNKNSWLDCSSGNCVERTSDQTQSTQSTPFYFSQSQDKWNAMSRQQEAENEMKKLTKGKK